MVRRKAFNGQKALITGGSSGIGLAIARVISAKGAEVLLAARDPVKLKKASEDIGKGVSTYRVDVSNPESVRRLSEEIGKDHGRIDILVNSAGIVEPRPLVELSVESISGIIDTDLSGTVLTVKEILPMMGAGGHIVNISSMAGIMGLWGYTAYSAAKFGVLGFSESLRMELRPRGIGVSVVFPPDTLTPQLEYENSIKPEELRSISSSIRPIPPEKVADAAVMGIVRNRFMVFPDTYSRMTYIGYRIAGPIMRAWMDNRIRKASSGGAKR